MRLLALDISSRNTGWTLLESGKPTLTGDIAPPETGHPGKLHFFRTQILDICAKHQPLQLCIEDVWAGKNKLTYKILSLYHGVVYQLSAELGLQMQIMTPSRFRRLVGAVHKVKLNYADREQAKAAVGTLVCSLYPELSSASEDVHDSVGIALAAHYWHQKFSVALEAAKTANPKIRSESRLADIADKATEAYFKDLEKENAKSMGSAGGESGDVSGGSEKGIQKTSTKVPSRSKPR